MDSFEKRNSQYSSPSEKETSKQPAFDEQYYKNAKDEFYYMTDIGPIRLIENPIPTNYSPIARLKHLKALGSITEEPEHKYTPGVVEESVQLCAQQETDVKWLVSDYHRKCNEIIENLRQLYIKIEGKLSKQLENNKQHEHSIDLTPINELQYFLLHYYDIPADPVYVEQHPLLTTFWKFGRDYYNVKRTFEQIMEQEKRTKPLLTYWKFLELLESYTKQKNENLQPLFLDFEHEANTMIDIVGFTFIHSLETQ